LSHFKQSVLPVIMVQQGRSYTAPRARITATETFILGLIARSQTRKIGRVPSVQSAQAEIAECAYVESAITLGLTHLPAAPAYFVQK
jgi:hypothetical protein